MQDKARTPVHLLRKNIPVITALSVALFCFIAYLTTLVDGITRGDSPEVSQATTLLGVMHPTGYPFYTLVNHFLMKLLFWIDDPAHRLNHLVAFWGAAAVFLLAANGRRVAERITGNDGDPKWPHIAGGALAALAFGTSGLFWEQARIAEVYTFHVFLMMLSWHFWLRFAATGERKWVLGCALAMGLGMTHHLTMAHLFPAALVYLLIKDWQFIKTRYLPYSLAIGIGTFSIYLYLPIADLTTTGFPWGGTSEWGFFWYHITGSHYHHFLFESWQTAVRHLNSLAGLLAGGATYPGLVLAGVGILLLAKRPWRLAIFIMLYLVTALTHAVGYNVGDWRVYLLAPAAVIAMTAGGALGALIELSSRRIPKMVAAIAWGIIGVIIIGLTIWRAEPTWRTYANEAPFVPAMANQVTLTVPDGAILMLLGDTNCYSTWYYQNVKGQGKNFAAMNVLRVRDRWYTEFLAERWPWLQIPQWVGRYRVARGIVSKFLGQRPIFERNIFTGKVGLYPNIRLINRGFVNEIVPREDAPAKRIYVTESWLTNHMDNGKPGLPMLRFSKSDRIRLIISWHDRIHRKVELRWISPDGNIYVTRDLDVSARARRSSSSLRSKPDRKSGNWKVEGWADGVMILQVDFSIE